MWRQILYALGLVAQVGLTIVISAGLGWWGGAYLDARSGRGVVFSVLGLSIGVVGGFIVVYRLLLRGFSNGGGFGDG